MLSPLRVAAATLIPEQIETVCFERAPDVPQQKCKGVPDIRDNVPCYDEKL